ncbi:MAG: hypothetical protein FD177_2231 [Desulfovibrionaceae bacterium]|nr:MAG: hypothetical protein FD177_2231 [Desulfovibrionaceae bacterium]
MAPSPQCTGEKPSLSAPARLLFLGDAGRSECLEALFRGRWARVEYRIAETSIRKGSLHRHASYLRIAELGIFLRRRHNFIFVWQQCIALYLSLLSLLWPFARRLMLVVYVIFKPSSQARLTRLKQWLMLRMIRADEVHKVFFMSSRDGLYAPTPPEKSVVLTSFSTHSEHVEARMAASPEPGSYYLSYGASNRNYPLLKALALRMPQKEFRIACLPQAAAELAPLPPNLHTVTDAYGKDFENLLMGAKAVLLPLHDAQVVSGQLVCLQAMQASIPIFITKNDFLNEWVLRADQLSFLASFRDLADLQAQLSVLTREELLSRGCSARKHFIEKLTEEAFYEQLAGVIADVRRELELAFGQGHMCG